jgi:hypothetical protein
MSSGPYKRRTSSLYQPDQYPLQPLQPLTHTHQSQPAHQPHQNQPYFNRPQLDQPPHDPITQAFAAAFDKPTWMNGRRQSINPIQSHGPFQPPTSMQGQGQGQGQGVYGYAAPPPPPPISFQNTPNQHGHGDAPRQRIPSISTTHIPPTNTINTDGRRGSMSSIFPISLHTFSGQDPFSRTVSPIGYKFSLPLSNSNLSSSTTATAAIGMDIDQDQPSGDVMEGINNDYSMSSITPPEINVVDFAYSNPGKLNQTQGNQGAGMVYHSAPTSPRGTRMDTDMNMAVGRASSAEPPSSSTFVSLAQSGDTSMNVLPNQNQPTGMGVGVGMITPIPMPILGDREPSLFALMNTSTTPLSQPTQTSFQGPHGQDSPTLFDGLPPMSNHHPFDIPGERERRMSLFGSMQLSSLPNAGGVGRLSLSKGSEGIGLGLGLEHVS